jgi:hypothetical protein
MNENLAFKSNVYGESHIIRDALGWLYDHFEDRNADFFANALTFSEGSELHFQEFEKYYQVYMKPMDFNEYDKLSVHRTREFYFAFVMNNYYNFIYLVVAFTNPEDAVLFKMTFDHQERS